MIYKAISITLAQTHTHSQISLLKYEKKKIWLNKTLKNLFIEAGYNNFISIYFLLLSYELMDISP